MKSKIYIRFVSVMLTLMLILAAVVQVAAAQPAVKTISLKEAIDTAIKNNAELKLMDDQIAVAERRYNTSKVTADIASKKNVAFSDAAVEVKKDELLIPLQKENYWNELKWSKDDKLKTLKVSITKLYHWVLFAQERVDSQTKNIQRAKEQYDLKKKEFEAGKTTEVSLLQYEIAISTAQTNLAVSEKKRDTYLMDLNKLIGFSVTQKLKLKPEKLPDEEYKVSNMDKLVEERIVSSHSVKKLEKDVELAKKEREIVLSYSYSPDKKPDAADDLEDKVLNLGYSIRDQKVAIEYEIRSDYNNLLNLKDDIALRKMNFDKAVKLNEVAKIKYNIGTISYLELMAAQESVDNSIIEYKMAQLKYYIAVENFKNYITQ